jgi:glutaredoxin
VIKLIKSMNRFLTSARLGTPIALAVALFSTLSTGVEAKPVQLSQGENPATINTGTINTGNSPEAKFAEFLNKRGAKFYGAYWCPHCTNQKRLFGEEAQSAVPYVECARDAQNNQADMCKQAGIRVFPTWVIDGQLYPGSRELKDLAKLTGYKGSVKFKYRLR